MRFRPFGFPETRLPKRLRLGPVDDDFAEALELAARAAIQKRVVGKAVGRDEVQAVGRGHRAAGGPMRKRQRGLARLWRTRTIPPASNGGCEAFLLTATTRASVTS